MHGDAARNDLELHVLEAMVDAAYGLGMRITEAAEAEQDVTRLLTFTEAFNRCFHAVRMGIRLSLSLRAGAKAAAAPTARDAEEPAERTVEHEPLRDRPDRETDRERDRDYEPVSLSRFLATLRGVTREAERLQVGTDEAAHICGLLAEVDAGPAAPKPRPPSPAKGRFFSSTAPSVFKPDHPPRPRRGGASQSGDPGFFR